MRFALSISTMALTAVLAVTNVSAQSWTSAYTSPTATGDCSALPAALNTGFTSTPVVSLGRFAAVAPYRVLKMAFWMQPGATYNDIYIVEKGTSNSARVLYYDAVEDTLKVIGTLTVAHGTGGVNEQGLLGIAVNPVSFGTDHHLYLFYSVGTSPNSAHAGSADVGWRVVRYTLDATTRMIDMASAKVIIHIPAGNNARWHTGGAMQFDKFGNLYIATGENEALATGAGNTADLRGAILRIKPDNSERGYSIPAGNFGDYWGQKWHDSGLTTRAGEYRDTSKVKAEIYVKGSRNPYTFSVDPNRLGWLRWSECGPDAQRAEEHNFTTKPAFSGWPFWAGNGVRQTAKANQYNESPDVGTGDAWTAFNYASMTTTIPVNNFSGNTGVDTLPPMHVPAYAYTSPSCAVGGGPIIRYDGSISNPGKMPPHLNNVTFFADYMGSNYWAKQIDTVTGNVTPVESNTATAVFTQTRTGRPNLNDPVDFQQGADGSLYVIDWGRGNNCCPSDPSTTNNGIARVTYTGTCQDTALTPGSITSLKDIVHRGSVDWLRVGMNEIRITADGAHSVKVLDLNGRIVHTFSGNGNRAYAMPENLSVGTLYVLRVETNLGTAVRTFSRI